MRKSFLVVVLSLFIFGSYSFAQEKTVTKEKTVEKETVVKEGNETKKSETKVNAETQAKTDKKVMNEICPVSGEELENHKHTFEHNGKTYAVCCKKCLKKAQADPDKYASRLSEDGKSLKSK